MALQGRLQGQRKRPLSPLAHDMPIDVPFSSQSMSLQLCQHQAGDGREYLEDSKVHRVLRGGSWNYDHNYARVTYRNYFLPFHRYYFFGMRVVRHRVLDTL